MNLTLKMNVHVHCQENHQQSINDNIRVEYRSTKSEPLSLDERLHQVMFEKLISLRNDLLA